MGLSCCPCFILFLTVKLITTAYERNIIPPIGIEPLSLAVTNLAKLVVARFGYETESS